MGESPVKLLADILHKAQGRIDHGTGSAIDVGYEVTRLRKHHDLAAEQIERLEAERRELMGLLSCLICANLCKHDHTRYCQEYGDKTGDDRCIYAIAEELIAKIDAQQQEKGDEL